MNVITKSARLSLMFTIIQMAVIYLPYILAKTKNRKKIGLMLFIKPIDFIGSCIFLFVISVITSSFDNPDPKHTLYSYLGTWGAAVLANSDFFILYPFLLKISNSRLIPNSSLQKNCDYKFKSDIPVYITTSDLTNAIAIGFLPTNKIIVIGKSLVENLSEDEVLAIVYHEQAHHKSNDLLKFFGFMCLAVLAFILGKDLFIQFAGHLFVNLDKGLLTGVFGGLHALVFYIIIFSKLSYRAEYNADDFSAKHVGPLNMINALGHLNTLTSGLLTYDSITHPSLKKRINNIKKLNAV